jgi:zinc/manganese transport system permease protein
MIDAALVPILLPAMAAGIVVLATHVPMGQEVLRRGIIFIDLAVAQIAALGVLVAALAEWQSSWIVQSIAITMALLGALLLSWTGRRWPDEQEAIIGISFVLAASASILLLANNPHGGEHLKELLAGQILWVEWFAILVTAMLYALLLAVWFGARRRLGDTGFYLLFAVNVTLSVQLVGVYLVFASLIVPALATVSTNSRHRLYHGYILGVIAYAAGLLLSWRLDLPSGAVITWMLALLALLYRFLWSKSAARARG